MGPRLSSARSDGTICARRPRPRHNRHSARSSLPRRTTIPTAVPTCAPRRRLAATPHGPPRRRVKAPPRPAGAAARCCRCRRRRDVALAGVALPHCISGISGPPLSRRSPEPNPTLQGDRKKTRHRPCMNLAASVPKPLPLAAGGLLEQWPPVTITHLAAGSATISPPLSLFL